jgi:TRAP-type C4-dicarboxylate transport system permease small subunit
MKILNKLQVLLYDFFYNITGLVLAVILSTVLAGIVSRYIFNKPFIWTEELCTILMVYLAYFSAPMATIAQEHVVADFFKGLLPTKFNRILTLVIRLFEIGFFVIVAISCIHYIPNKTYRTPTLLIPRFVFYIPVLVGTVVMVYAICVHVLNDIVPGYNYFKQRQEAREQELKRQEQAEEQELISRMDSFMDEVEKSAKEKGEQS